MAYLTEADSDTALAPLQQAACVYADKVVYRNPPVVPNLSKPDALMISVDEIQRIGLSEAVDTHILKHWRDLFFVKSRDWEQEREFRWVVTGNANEDFYVGIEHSLVGIALGHLFPDALKVRVGQFAVSNSVTLAIMNWQNGVPQPHPTHWQLLRDQIRTRRGLLKKFVDKLIDYFRKNAC
jgi:hypothetical protein